MVRVCEKNDRKVMPVIVDNFNVEDMCLDKGWEVGHLEVLSEEDWETEDDVQI